MAFDPCRAIHFVVRPDGQPPGGRELLASAFAQLSAADLDKRRKALNDLLHEQWEYTLRTSPEFASILGDRRYNDQVSDVSEKAAYADIAESKKFLKRFEAIDTTAKLENTEPKKAPAMNWPSIAMFTTPARSPITPWSATRALSLTR